MGNTPIDSKFQNIEKTLMKLMTMARTKRVFTLLLRVLALGATFAAAVVMATSHEKANMFGVRFEAKFSHTPAFK